ncbi:MAG TPA: zf-HC2 domain-containing protein [Candidatus Deferrimicrobium sp.]|nr:zf-HC2 domain-containing protein [Candidatus Deferrimicrobium sp.]
MTCQQALLLLDDYTDGRLVSASELQLRSHLDLCRKCREEFAAVGRLRLLMSRMPKPDPGPEYWLQTQRRIVARAIDSTVERSPATSLKRVSSPSQGRAGLGRALVSLAASLLVLFGAILLGTGTDTRLTSADSAESPVLATAPVSQLIGPDRRPIITPTEQMRLARGMTMMGAPSFIGKFAGLKDLTDTVFNR